MRNRQPVSWSHLELELNSRERALGEIGSALAHDLQEPVRNIRSFAKLLDARIGATSDPDVQEMLSFLEQAADGLGARFQQLVQYSRQQTRPMRNIESVSALLAVETAVSANKPSLNAAKAKIDFGEMPDVEIDSDTLTQVFSHLIENSLKCRSNQDLRIKISAEWRHGLWQFTVRDNGIGIEPRLHERAFQLFRQVHHEREGAGVGLAFCRQAIERSGGRMWLASRADRGCSLIFTLPGQAPVDLRQPTQLRAVT